MSKEGRFQGQRGSRGAFLEGGADGPRRSASFSNRGGSDPGRAEVQEAV